MLINLTTYAAAQDSQGLQPAESSASHPSAYGEEPAWLDSVDISLLTCGPGQEVWSYYGHTALRIEDHAHGDDLAVNWGMFSFNQDYFVLRFVFGLTDYQIGIFPMARFIEEYSSEGRWVRQQRLKLSKAEKRRILTAIDENNRPENKTYRYNFFFDNCTTRARDMILSHLSVSPRALEGVDAQSSYRAEIHRWNESHRWARFGNDLLLGFQADRPISKKEWEFLPENLMKLFETEPSYAKLVDSTFYVVAPQAEESAAEAITPSALLLLIGLGIALVCAWEWYKKKNLWWFDTILLAITGIPGLILLAMVFSEHPTVQLNFQMLVLNPLNLVFAWAMAKKLRNKGQLHWYYHVWFALLALSIIMQFWQSYADGISLLALSLLVRYETRLKLCNHVYRKKEKQEQENK